MVCGRHVIRRCKRDTTGYKGIEIEIYGGKDYLGKDGWV